MGDAEAIRRAASIVTSRRDRQPIVVVSALAGVTNALLAIAEQSSRGQLIGAIRSVEALRERHMQQAELLLGDTTECAELCSEMSAMVDELAHLTEALNTLGDVTPRSLDAIAAYGEQLSSTLAVAAFKRCGLPAEHVDARDVVVTDDAFTRAEPNVDAISEAALRRLAPVARDGRIPVMGGFIGATPRGLTTTLGRGGSDYTAALLGAALQAEAIELWTDVDGMRTADPRVVEGAPLLGRFGLAEAW